MAGTFSQIYIQYVFAVKGRENLLQKPWRDEVFKYMAGIIKGKNQKSIIVNGVEDHVHVFVGLKPSMCIADLIRDVKNNSSTFINDQKFVGKNFHGRRGMALFRTLIRRLSRCIITLLIRKNTTGRKHSKKNTLIFFRNLKLNTTRNICLNGWIEL